MVKLEELLGDRYALLNNTEKTSYVLGSELWKQIFTLSLVVSLL